jgi:hypothetical protein
MQDGQRLGDHPAHRPAEHRRPAQVQRCNQPARLGRHRRDRQRTPCHRPPDAGVVEDDDTMMLDDGFLRGEQADEVRGASASTNNGAQASIEALKPVISNSGDPEPTAR